jgi:RNA-directed DNA polymerase
MQAPVTWGDRQVIDADVQAGVDARPHEGVVAAVARRRSDPGLRRRMRRWLKAGGREEGEGRTAGAGSPQGGVISPVRSQAYGHAFDVEWETTARGATLLRSGDDDVIRCRGNPQPGCQRMARLITGLG